MVIMAIQNSGPIFDPQSTTPVIGSNNTMINKVASAAVLQYAAFLAAMVVMVTWSVVVIQGHTVPNDLHTALFAVLVGVFGIAVPTTKTP
jgi:hypothetical protein